MASTIQLKTGTGSAVPTSLAQGEVAINIENGLFYFGSGSGEDVKILESFTHITASGNISASGNIIANNGDFKGILSILGFSNVSESLAAAVAGGDNLGNHTATENLNLDSNNIIGVNHITSSGNIIGSTGSFAQTVITLESGAEDSPFLVKVVDNNGQDNKLEVTKDGILKYGALDTLPTAITGSLAYSASAFYMGL